MSRLAVEWGFYISLACGLPLGILLMVLWGRRILRPLTKGMRAREHISIPEVAARAFVLMLPGLVIFIVCCIPVLYFGDLRKQREYCLKVIAVNEGMAKDSRLLRERCGCFDIDELFAEHSARER